MSVANGGKPAGSAKEIKVLNRLGLRLYAKVCFLQQFESGWLQPPTLKPNIDKTFNIFGVPYLNAKCYRNSMKIDENG